LTIVAKLGNRLQRDSNVARGAGVPGHPAAPGALLLGHCSGAAMPTIDPDKVCHIIAKARAIDVKVAPVAPESSSNPTDDDMREEIEDRGDDLTEQELHDFLAGLNQDEQEELVVMTWIGRGSFTAEEWDEAMAELRSSPRPMIDELMGEPMLGDLLADGLAAFGHRCDE
jgi:hypothetical protein